MQRVTYVEQDPPYFSPVTFFLSWGGLDHHLVRRTQSVASRSNGISKSRSLSKSANVLLISSGLERGQLGPETHDVQKHEERP